MTASGKCSFYACQHETRRLWEVLQRPAEIALSVEQQSRLVRAKLFLPTKKKKKKVYSYAKVGLWCLRGSALVHSVKAKVCGPNKDVYHTGFIKRKWRK